MAINNSITVKPRADVTMVFLYGRLMMVESGTV